MAVDMQRVVQGVRGVVHSQTGSMWFASIIPEGTMGVDIRTLRARNVVTVKAIGVRAVGPMADYVMAECA